MAKWYTVYSFPTHYGYTEDLSNFFQTAGIANVHRKNVTWRLMETNYTPDGYLFDGFVHFWTGGVQPDGSLDQGGAPTGFSFFDPFACGPPDPYMELQVSYDEEPTCPEPPSPWPILPADEEEECCEDSSSGGCGSAGCSDEQQPTLDCCS